MLYSSHYLIQSVSLEISVLKCYLFFSSFKCDFFFRGKSCPKVPWKQPCERNKPKSEINRFKFLAKTFLGFEIKNDMPGDSLSLLVIFAHFSPVIFSSIRIG